MNGLKQDSAMYQRLSKNYASTREELQTSWPRAQSRTYSACGWPVTCVRQPSKEIMKQDSEKERTGKQSEGENDGVEKKTARRHRKARRKERNRQQSTEERKEPSALG